MTQEIKQVDITIEAGADFQMLFIVRDESGNLVDLTGSTVEAQLREYAEASDYLQFTATHNGSGGKVSISMPHEDTAVIPYTAGVYDVYITDTNNIREKYLTGDVTVIPSVTKPVAGEIIYLLSFSSEDDFPTTGIVRRIYFSHASNKMYRWNGTNYVSIVTDGEAATVEVGTVTTLDAGEDATVENVGSLNNAVFNFGIPKGDTGTTSWEGITDKPETFTPSAHTHDDRYYTETEVDTALSGKSDTGHTHDDRYYTENEVDTLLSAKADTSTVNSALASKADASSVYTKGQVDTLVGGKVSTTSVGSLAYQNSVNYATEVTNKPTLGDLASQNTISYESTYLTNKPTLGTMSAESASDYYTKTETDTLLSAKADSADLGTMSAEDASDYYDKTATDALLSEKADIIHTSASGSLVHITDGAAYPVDSLTVDIDPVQDLHGYDAPWPAGGGYNKFNYDAWKGIGIARGTGVFENNGITLTATGNDCYTNFTSGYFTESMRVYVSEGDIVKLTWECSVNTGTVYIFGNGDSGKYTSANSSSQTVSYTVPSDVTFVTFRLGVNASGNTTSYKNLMIQVNTTQTTWQPYSNVCPISGHSSATVTRTGKNLWDKANAVWYRNNSSNFSETADSSTTRIRSNSLPIRCGGQTITVSGLPSGITLLQIRFFDKYQNKISEVLTSASATAPVGTEYVHLMAGGSDFTSATNTLMENADIQLELSSSATAYESPHVQTVTIALGSTYYGAQLDAVAGTLTVDRAIFDLGDVRDSTWWAYDSTQQYMYSNAIANYVKKPSSSSSLVENALCSFLDVVTAYSIYNGGSGIGVHSSGELRIKYNGMPTNVSDFKQEISGQTFVYPLATPVTITGLTPAQIQALQGLNNVWADTGGTSIGYRADTKRYIDSKLSAAIAELQALILENS